MFPPIETSQDILFYALAVAALCLAFFLCWSLYYLIMTLRDARIMTRDIRKRIEMFWEVVELAREKLQLGGAVFKLAATGIRELAEYVRQYTEGAGTASKRPKKKKKEE